MKLVDLGYIGVAWWRSIDPTPEQQALAEERLSICETCEHRVPSTIFGGYKCDACGCPLHKKIFSPAAGPSACPKQKWVR